MAVERPPGRPAGRVPSLLMVDADNRLQRVIVDAAVMREAEAYQE
jgi:hypothetical protein